MGNLLCIKRIPSSDNLVSSSDTSTLLSPIKMSKSDDVLTLQEASNTNNATDLNETHEEGNLTPLSRGSSGPLPSPVPTSSMQLEHSSSSSGFFSSEDKDPSRASSVTLSDLWEPRSTSTPAPEEGVPVDLGQVSTQMLKNILKTVEGEPSNDETKDAIFTKDELVILVSRFKDLCGKEKQELFEYMKFLEVKNPQLVNSVREEVINPR